MKLVGIGDLFIPAQVIEKSFAQWLKLGVDVASVDWHLPGFGSLQEINHQIEQFGPAAYQPPDYILDACRDADIVVTEFCPISRSFIDNCRNLKLIGVLRAGCENVDTRYADEKGIAVCKTPGRNADSVADFTVGMMISEARNIARGHAGLKNGEWIREYPNQQYIPDFPGKTIGIIGLGDIGRKVARRLTGFDVEIIGNDPYVAQPPTGIRMVSLDELMSQSDFVTIHVRLTRETVNLIDRRLIDLMKPTSYLINTARSALVDEQALFEALRDQRIAGAGLDVFSIEPPGKDYPLVTLPNVTLTPHMAGGSSDAFLQSPGKLSRDLLDFRQGNQLSGLLNPGLAETLRIFLR